MQPPRYILIVVNPASCRGRARQLAPRLAARLRLAGANADLRETTRRGEAQSIARQAVEEGLGVWGGAKPDCVVPCGGDGTVQEVANALVQVRQKSGAAVALGLAPAGRCNDFARALGVKPDLDAIVMTLMDGLPQPIDLGQVNGRCFCTVATVGVDAEISGFVDNMRMPLTGTAAYLYGALRVLVRYRPPVLRITLREFQRHRGMNDSVIERPMFIASGANTSSYGGAIPIAPDASPTDGYLDLCLIDHVSRFRMISLVPAVLRGTHAHCPEVRFVKARSWTVDADRAVDIWADGEPVARTPATFEVLPAAVDVLLPPGSQTEHHTPVHGIFA